MLALIALGLASLSILLGFIALLTQKIYLDAKTRKTVHVDIPLLGKMKTNYPALVFVFLGFGLAFYVLKENKENEWNITGQFEDSEINDWRAGGELILFPQKLKPDVDLNGRFTITMQIEEGQTFEDMIEKIEYSHRDGGVVIYPRDEYTAYKKGEPSSKLEKVGPHLRTYKPLRFRRTGEK
jgi:hypothetical protein